MKVTFETIVATITFTDDNETALAHLLMMMDTTSAASRLQIRNIVMTALAEGEG